MKGITRNWNFKKLFEKNLPDCCYFKVSLQYFIGEKKEKKKKGGRKESRDFFK